MSSDMRSALAAAVLIVGALLAPGSALAAVDPGAVGTWELVVPTAQGVARWVWEIRADGTYAFRSEGPGAVPGHSGTVEIAGGTWALHSPGWTDGGTYRFADKDSLVATGKLGTAMWKRGSAAAATGAPSLATTQVNGQAIPRDLPSIVKAGTDAARRWRSDAVLVELNVKPLGGSRQSFFVEQDFSSPSSRSGLWVVSGQPGLPPTLEVGPVNWSTTPIAPGFIDLPRALDVARQHGLAGPIDGAKLIVWRPGRREPVLAWTIAPVNGVGAYFVEGMPGVYLPGDVTGYVEEYNRQWDAVAQRLREAIGSIGPPSEVPSAGAPPAPPPSSGINKSLIHDSTSCAVAGGLWMNPMGTLPGRCQ